MVVDNVKKNKKAKFIEQSSQNIPIMVVMKVQTAYTEIGSSKSKWISSRVQTKQNITPPETRMRNKDNSFTFTGTGSKVNQPESYTLEKRLMD